MPQLRFFCPICQKDLYAEERSTARLVQCPKCKSRLKIPAAKSTLIPAAPPIHVDPPPIQQQPPECDFQIHEDGTVYARWTTVSQAIALIDVLDDLWQDADLAQRRVKEDMRSFEHQYKANNRQSGPGMYGLGRSKEAHFVRWIQFAFKAANGHNYATNTNKLQQQVQLLANFKFNLEHLELQVHRWLRDVGHPQKKKRSRRRR